MPAMPERELLKLIKEQGFTVVRTTKGHYKVISPDGRIVTSYAVGHGKNKGMIKPSYVNKVLKEMGLK